MNSKSYSVAIYIRVSTNQVSQEASLEYQKKLLMDYIRNNGHSLYKIYLDIGTGTNTNRKQFKQLVKDAKEKKFDMVISKELSRLARNARVSYEFKDVIMENEIHIVTLDGAVNTLTDGWSMFGLYAWIYESESRNTSRRIKDTFAIAAKSGRFIKGDPPYGYTVSDGKLYLREDITPDIVRTIYRMYLEGNGANKISKHLMEMGYPTPGQIKGRSNSSSTWHESSIKLILRNRHYIGDLEQGKESAKDIGMNKDKKQNLYKRNKNKETIIVENTHEPIVSREDYFAVQKLLDERAMKSKDRATPRKRLFSDKVFCADCQKKLWAISYRGFYVCGTYKKKGKDACTIHKVKEQDLIEIIQDDLRRFSADMKDIESAKQTLEDRLKTSKIQYDKMKAKYEKKLEKLQEKKGKLVIKLIDETIPKSAYDAAVSVVDKDIIAAETTLNNLYEENNFETEQEKLIRLHEQFKAIKNFDVIDREIINRFVDKIIVHESEKVEIHYNFKMQ